MAENTAISWCDSTFNPHIGCTKISPGCDDCYAARSTPVRAMGIVWGPGQPRVRTSAANWRKPLQWNARDFVQCAACSWRGEHAEFQQQQVDGIRSCCPACGHFAYRAARRRVFCASLADVFDNEAPAEWRTDLWALIEATPNLDWLLLTKRIGNVMSMIPESWATGRLPKHVLIGATMVNQPERDRDMAKLLAVPAYRHFLSLEPLLSAVKLNLPIGHDGKALIDWVIAGGESGSRARQTHPTWVRGLRDECAAAGVPFHFKQWGEWAPYDRSQTDGAILATPYCLDEPIQRFGKKLAGHLLDGKTHDAFPEVLS